jgi:hypothetical protein
MNAMDARTSLLVQHELIRCLLRTCSALARRSLAGEAVSDQLDEVLGQLCHEVAAHHRTEVAMIADPRNALGWGTPVDRAFHDQITEHATLWTVMYATPAEDAAAVLALVRDLEAHMVEEERTFLAPPFRPSSPRSPRWGLLN